MWDIVGNLGIKDGIQEFREQFSKDAKVTIANSTFAKNRGLDVAALDDLEMNLENKLHQQTAELHARTVGAAVKTIARDETLAQLLDVQCSREVPCESDELDLDLSQSVDSIDSPFAGDATGACEPQHLGAGEAEGAYGSSSAPLRDRFSPSAAVLDSVRTIQAGGHDSPESPKHAQQPHLPAGSSAGSSVGSSARRADENARRLEEEVARITAANKALENQLAAASAENLELQSRWSQISTVSDEAFRESEAAKQEACAFRRAVEERDTRIVELQEALEGSELENVTLREKVEEIQSQFQDRLESQVTQRELELTEEMDYLRKAVEAKEKKIETMSAKTERRASQSFDISAPRSAADREALLDAHSAIAKAFGDVMAENPCLRVLDEPTLKFTALLFKQPLLRRLYYIISVFLWVFALLHAIGGWQQKIG
mmetsp:Transcript_26734/g.70215  ORF Transcript_26734/g.70215 Transcript_26734/m.70215 type:complete len:431 (-) Transcript_26734:470-1762(-)|eukprot:CAMPEP_0194520944 /NCGR_PEP_ID=MMETSP0253-20130528/55100_1 /TAXON_ID=2966 /ORGANISM="Noctiluca scintillans" /LENGTH=430 /DNA_ID=CAMNT_0039365245 /DNA_START=27 /DNA_END=1319 /DNA_ORIENTATION=-